MPPLQTYRPAMLALPLALSLALLLGCARPGPPRAPSLHIPAIVTDLSAARTGNVVELRFTAPTHASDGVPLPAGDLRGVLCRQLGPSTQANTCDSVTGIDITIAAKAGPQTVHLEDTLPTPLTTGAPRLLTYRVQIFSPTGRSLGESDPAYSVAGDAPTPIAAVTATGARNGIILTWNPEASTEDDVLLERTDLTAPATARKPHTPMVPHRTTKRAIATPERIISANITWLQANADPGTGRTLDTTADPDTLYQYRALRRRTVRLGGRTLELRSAPSPPQQITLLQIYPPAAPTGLSIAAYFERFGAAQTNELAPTFAVDLVWQPVDDDTRTAPLAGYNLYRETLNAQGQITAAAKRLNPTPILLPSFHDTTAKPTERYRYRVTAIDTSANESPATTTILEPQS